MATSFDKYFGGCNNHEKEESLKVMDVVQSNFSDSNTSEVSVSESVGTNNNRPNISISGESENVGATMLLPPFIDFLGVGAS